MEYYLMNKNTRQFDFTTYEAKANPLLWAANKGRG